MTRPVYLDSDATTPVAPDVIVFTGCATEAEDMALPAPPARRLRH